MATPRSTTSNAKRATPAERAGEFHAEQLRLKQEAADRRAAREAAGEPPRRRRGRPAT